MFLHDVVVVVLGQCSHQPEVPYLDQVAGGQQQISGGQVPVDEDGGCCICLFIWLCRFLVSALGIYDASCGVFIVVHGLISC